MVEKAKTVLNQSGLVVKSRLRGWRVPGPKPDFTEDPPSMWACCTLNHTWSALPLAWCGGMEREVPARPHPRHLTAVQNCEVRSKIALVLLQNGTLM
ncbi:hypothetical protein AVEN_150266-1 [Araneus ventricosus]|uniref:Uncharacterized protein n=1 Tax=Araneus ventricosus TaxID=182803 RepID=A0A4Y2HCY3_ARAVE|nr:hypothetical protein AVEN_150266-1 [Araneus ventricosus]